MLHVLRALFALILISMLGVTSWASYRCPLFAIPEQIGSHPWFIATLFDAYWGFLTFFVWVGWKQTGWIARIAWLVAILLLGNIAMSAYCLSELFQTRSTGEFAKVLVTRRPGHSPLGLILATVGILVIAGAWFTR